MGRVRVLVIVIVAANVLNVGANWALIFGHLGLPALGAVGSGLATTLSRLFMAVCLAWAAWPALRPYLRPWRTDVLAPRPLGRMLWLGVPIGVQFLLEVGAFSAAGFFMGRFDRADYLAGHQIALNLAALTFMVPLGISAAAAVRVGHGIGSGDSTGVRRTAVVALIGGAGFMLLSAAAFTTVPRALAAIFAPDEVATLAIAALVIPVAGAFQVFDGVQIVAAGLLRGAGDTRWPTLVHILGFWVLGIPLGWWLMFRADVVPTGPWWGLALALAVVAGVLLWRVRYRLWGPLTRIQIDDQAPNGA
jgi:MATE family multidrug resistance protein